MLNNLAYVMLSVRYCPFSLTKELIARESLPVSLTYMMFL
jgi:hypothetical protein